MKNTGKITTPFGSPCSYMGVKWNRTIQIAAMTRPANIFATGRYPDVLRTSISKGRPTDGLAEQSSVYSNNLICIPNDTQTTNSTTHASQSRKISCQERDLSAADGGVTTFRSNLQNVTAIYRNIVEMDALLQRRLA